MPFDADCTLILPPGLVHQIRNTGTDMRLAAWLAESPARVLSSFGRAALASVG